MNKIAIVAYDGCWAMSVCSVKDFFRIVSLLERHLGMEPAFTAEILSLTGGSAVSASGIVIVPDKKLDPETGYDLVVIPPMEGPALLSGQWKTSSLIPWLNQRIAENCTVLAMTTAVCFLAATDMADEKLLATHWAYIRYLKEQFPNVNFIGQGAYRCHDRIYTTGSLEGCFDALLEYVATINGDRFSQLCAANLLVSDPYKLKPMLSGHRNHRDEAIIQVQDWIESNYSSAITIQELAQSFNFSDRNLKRRFQAATGISINQYFQKARVDKAKKLLISSEMDVKAIAYAVGYENVSFFIRVFKRSTGVTPSGWRNGELPPGD